MREERAARSSAARHSARLRNLFLRLQFAGGSFAQASATSCSWNRRRFSLASRPCCLAGSARSFVFNVMTCGPKAP